MTIAITISLVGVIIAGVVGYTTARYRSKSDDRQTGAEKGVMMSELGYIKSGVDDIKRENKETQQKISNISERVTRCEESCKQAHHRIDEMKGGE